MKATIRVQVTDLDRYGIESARSASFSLRQRIENVIDALVSMKMCKDERCRTVYENAIVADLSAILWHYLLSRGQVTWEEEDGRKPA